MFEGRQRVVDANFMLWVSSPQLKQDFEFLASFLTTDCTNVDFIPNFLSGSWIPSFYQQKKADNARPFSSLFKSDQAVTHQMLCDALEDNYRVPGFFAKPIMARVDPKVLRRGDSTIPSRKLAFLGEILDNKSPNERYFGLLTAKTGRDVIISSDFAPFIIRFLSDNKEFEAVTKDVPVCSLFARYIITRLFMIYDPEFRGRITWRSFQAYDFLATLKSIAKFDQFRVAYELFMKHDKDSTNGISHDDFVKFDSGRIHPKVMERIWRFLPGDKSEGRLSFGDFVYFLLLLEDKSSVASLNFWFRVCDLDDDGILSLGEMDTLYEYQESKLRDMDLETVKFKDILPQVMDMIGSKTGTITRGDLKKSGDWPIFFNFLVDTKRFADWEFKDPLYNVKTKSTDETPWDHFCHEFNENAA